MPIDWNYTDSKEVKIEISEIEVSKVLVFRDKGRIVSKVR